MWRVLPSGHQRSRDVRRGASSRARSDPHVALLGRLQSGDQLVTRRAEGVLAYGIAGKHRMSHQIASGPVCAHLRVQRLADEHVHHATGQSVELERARPAGGVAVSAVCQFVGGWSAEHRSTRPFLADEEPNTSAHVRSVAHCREQDGRTR